MVTALHVSPRASAQGASLRRAPPQASLNRPAALAKKPNVH